MLWRIKEWCSDHSNWSSAARFDAIGSGLWSAAPGFLHVTDWLDEAKGSGEPLWTITTCRRARSCEAIVRKLSSAAGERGERPRVVVIEDSHPGDHSGATGESSPRDYSGVIAALDEGFGRDALFVSSARWLGKREFWKTHQLILDLVARLDPPYLLSLQDDIDFSPDAIDRALEIWHSIDDDDKAVLNLSAHESDQPGGRWVRFRRRESEDGTVRLTQWFDLSAYLAFPRGFDAWGHRVFPIDERRWQIDPTCSSGVARQLTRRLYLQRANVYQVASTLVYHGGQPSLLNPERRAIDPMNNFPKT